MEKQKVIVTDIKMSFWSMVIFMIKWTIASIPAFIILIILAALVMTLLAGIGYGLEEAFGSEVYPDWSTATKYLLQMQER